MINRSLSNIQLWTFFKNKKITHSIVIRQISWKSRIRDCNLVWVIFVMWKAKASCWLYLNSIAKQACPQIYFLECRFLHGRHMQWAVWKPWWWDSVVGVPEWETAGSGRWISEHRGTSAHTGPRPRTPPRGWSRRPRGPSGLWRPSGRSAGSLLQVRHYSLDPDTDINSPPLSTA